VAVASNLIPPRNKRRQRRQSGSDCLLVASAITFGIK